MTPEDLMADVPCPPGSRREAELHYRLLLRYLADHVYDAKLESGARMLDPIDFRTWLKELADALSRVTA